MADDMTLLKFDLLNNFETQTDDVQEAIEHTENAPQDSDLIDLIRNNILHDKIREQEQIKELKQEIEFLKSEILHKNNVITNLLSYMKGNMQENDGNSEEQIESSSYEDVETTPDEDNYDVRYESISTNNCIMRKDFDENNRCKHSNQHVMNKIIACSGKETFAETQFLDLKIVEEAKDEKLSRYTRRNVFHNLLKVHT